MKFLNHHFADGILMVLKLGTIVIVGFFIFLYDLSDFTAYSISLYENFLAELGRDVVFMKD